MAGDGPSVLLTSEYVTPVLIEHKFLASTLRACDSVSTQQWNGCSERLIEKFTQISPVKRVGCRCGRKLARKASGIHVSPCQMPRLLLERGISLNLRVSGRRGSLKAKNGVIVTIDAKKSFFHKIYKLLLKK